METFGLSDANQFMAVAQIQQGDMAALSLRPLPLHIVSMSGGLIEATTSVALGDDAFVACIAHLPNGIRLEYTTHKSFEELDPIKHQAIYGFRLRFGPVNVMMSNGQPFAWRTNEVAELEQSMLAIQDGFANIGRMTALGLLTPEEAADQIRTLKFTAPKATLESAKPKTRKIRIE